VCRILYAEPVAKIVPFTEARSTLSELLDEVSERQEHVVITRNGRPAAVVLSSEEYEALAETLEVLEDGETLEALRESEADVQAGRLFALDELRRELGLG
jgi:prevent-host-death family protein